MAGKYEKTQKRCRRRGLLLYILIPLLCGCLFGAWMMSKLPGFKYIGGPGGQIEEQMAYWTEAEQIQTQPTETQPEHTEPASKIATATLGAAGNIMLHDLVIQSGYDQEIGGYTFDNIYTWFSKYISEVDYAAANLESTLCGTDNGYSYSGYPLFNSPDEIVDATKAAGFDLLLTANNHTYDTKYTGFKRTQQVIAEREMDHAGTRLYKDDKRYLVRDINGIKIGMICYTYVSGYTNARNYILNGLALSTEATARTNAFHYKDLSTFYSNLAGELQKMKADGAEATVVFLHWGSDYNTVPNESQKKIAQQLCNMGVDVIIGSHPQVIQPVELLTSSSYEKSKTLCIYSTGNSVSNIYKSNSFPVHTEDGMLFRVTFAKYSNGTVMVESADVLPTWVRHYDDEAGVRKYQIMAMEAGTDWASEMELDEELTVKCQESFDRTMEIVGEGLETANAWFAQQQEEKETALGIR